MKTLNKNFNPLYNVLLVSLSIKIDYITNPSQFSDVFFFLTHTHTHKIIRNKNYLSFVCTAWRDDRV